LTRTFAAVMALLAMLVVLTRALKNHAGFDGTITNALVWMALFGVIGFIVAAIAQATVDQSVLQAVETELAATATPAEAVKPIPVKDQ